MNTFGMPQPALVAVAVFLLAACSQDSPAPLGPSPVASLTVAPATRTVLVGKTVLLVATVKDGAGNVLTDRVVTWLSSNPSLATVSATGLVTGVQADPAAASISATSEGVTGSAAITVMAPTPAGTLSFATVEAGAYHTCARTPAGAAYCWGYNAWGQLGNGTTSSADPKPEAVGGGLVFASVSVGGTHTCGLTASGAAYCWGDDAYGVLGAGAPGPEVCTDPYGQFPCSTLPLAVTGGLAFASLSAGWGPTCALTVNSTAYCWGDDAEGELGIGAETGSVEACTYATCSRTPLLVHGGLVFTTLAAAALHVCGLTASGTAYCWGSNIIGQLGIGADAAPDTCNSGPCSRTPVAVAGGLTFTALSAGEHLTCGHATDGVWYCWGSNNYGQLGNGAIGPELCQGTNPCSSMPVAVSGSISFATVFPGYRQSCAITADGTAYCWGWNEDGQLGNATRTNSLTPVAVAGGLTFANVSPEVYHTCGLTTGGVAFCWGDNTAGQLGDSLTNSSVPVRVVGQTGAATATAARVAVGGRRESASQPVQHSPVP